jgi:hypothetical protein
MTPSSKYFISSHTNIDKLKQVSPQAESQAWTIDKLRAITVFPTLVLPYLNLMFSHRD